MVEMEEIYKGGGENIGSWRWKGMCEERMGGFNGLIIVLII